MTACGRGVCAANEGHKGSCAEASGWGDEDLSLAAVIAKIDAASARVDAIGAPCPTCGHVPQSWRQPRVPRSVTWRGQERPGTESAHESPLETGETA